MTQLTAARTGTAPKYIRVAASIRAQIAEGILAPGESAPSGAELARGTGYSQLTCRKALQSLIKDGVLVPGPSANARPRVATPGATPDERTVADAGRALSGALAERRRAVGLTQIECAALLEVSVTAIGHAETGRLWQSRTFWERADKALCAGGGLLRLHDAYRAATVPAESVADLIPVPVADHTLANDTAITVGAPAAVACVTITWADGTVTTVRPPAVSRTSGDGTLRP